MISQFWNNGMKTCQKLNFTVQCFELTIALNIFLTLCIRCLHRWVCRLGNTTAIFIDGEDASKVKVLLGYIPNYYVFHDRVTLFFADNFSTECRITMKFIHNFF